MFFLGPHIPAWTGFDAPTSAPITEARRPRQNGPVDADSDAVVLPRMKYWREALRDAFCTVQGNVMVDVERPKSYTPPPRLRDAGSANAPNPTSIEDMDAIALMGAFLDRRPIPVAGGWALVREPEDPDSHIENVRRLTNWLDDAPLDEVKAMFGPGLPFGRLCPESKYAVARQCFVPGTQKRLAAGDLAVVRLRLDLLGSYSSDGQSRRMELAGFSQFHAPDRAALAQIRTGYSKPNSVATSPGRPNLGALDFSAGELLTYGELAERANVSFHKRWACDSRLARSWIFVRGRFTEAQFRQCATMVTRPLEWAEGGMDEAEVRRKLETTVRRRLALVDPQFAPPPAFVDAAFSRKTKLFSEIRRAFPGLFAAADPNAPSDDTPIRLSPALDLLIIGDNRGDREPEDPAGSSPIGTDFNLSFLFNP